MSLQRSVGGARLSFLFSLGVSNRPVTGKTFRLANAATSANIINIMVPSPPSMQISNVQAGLVSIRDEAHLVFSGPPEHLGPADSALLARLRETSNPGRFTICKRARASKHHDGTVIAGVGDVPNRNSATMRFTTTALALALASNISAHSVAASVATFTDSFPTVDIPIATTATFTDSFPTVDVLIATTAAFTDAFPTVDIPIPTTATFTDSFPTMDVPIATTLSSATFSESFTAIDPTFVIPPTTTPTTTPAVAVPTTLATSTRRATTSTKAPATTTVRGPNRGPIRGPNRGGPIRGGRPMRTRLAQVAAPTRPAAGTGCGGSRPGL
ncbi:hypothetical protein B0H66DRAFT_537460 [Apodospora peruviana]|uniref:Uncharacterized protein n=1 Tax=Apodospora peruviana TaxID=516989 RepID=A0AAE0HX63_9PEZI|nr:hypothetical protein B0H66DRAFT_537460 [Apodospora peruviana]